MLNTCDGTPCGSKGTSDFPVAVAASFLLAAQASQCPTGRCRATSPWPHLPDVVWKVGHQLSWPAEGTVCPVGQLQDRRLVLTKPLRNAEYMHVAQRQGGLVELPWGKKNIRPHVIPFLRVPAGFCGSTFSFAVASPDVRGPHVLASRQTNLAKAQARRSKFAGDTWDKPLECVNQSGDSFSSRHKQKCVRCSATHVECGVDAFLAFGTRIHHPMNRHFIRST